jgi:hypothetical protein
VGGGGGTEGDVMHGEGRRGEAVGSSKREVLTNVQRVDVVCADTIHGAGKDIHESAGEVDRVADARFGCRTVCG